MIIILLFCNFKSIRNRKGYYSIKDVNRLHNWVQDELKLRGCHIDQFYIAPYFSENKNFNRKDEDLRKPNTGMIDLALNKWSINKKKIYHYW